MDSDGASSPCVLVLVKGEGNLEVFVNEDGADWMAGDVSLDLGWDSGEVWGVGLALWGEGEAEVRGWE